MSKKAERIYFLKFFNVEELTNWYNATGKNKVKDSLYEIQQNLYSSDVHQSNDISGEIYVTATLFSCLFVLFFFSKKNLKT